MTNNLYHAAKKYVEVIEKIENTTNPEELQALEEKRIDMHWQFIDLLEAGDQIQGQGTRDTDRHTDRAR
jgi:hypothetical protein